MLWRRATQTQTPRPAAPVPSGESVRLAALKAAWRRDRWVARRRVWLRWTLWGAQRYGIPAAGVLGVLAGLWFAAQATMGWLDAPPPNGPTLASAPVQQPATSPAVLPTATTPPTPSSAPATSPTVQATFLRPYTVSNASGMLMKFDPALPMSARLESPVSSAALPSADKFPNPQLISENWLHSKEP